MKVVKKEAPKEEVKFTNVFGDEYAPEEYEFICDDCLAEEVESLKEDVTWLAEDILDHDDALEMLWEKIQAVEDEQVKDIENLSGTIDVLWCLQKANRMMLDTIINQDETIKVLDDRIRNTDNAWLYLFWFLVIWNIALSVLFALSIFDVL